MSPPRISVVIPVLNRDTTLEKAIKSVISQNYPDTELIIIDGGSTDNTLAIIQKYQQSIAYWHSKPDGSASVGSNLGAKQATGELIVLLMADDWFEANTFHEIAKAHQQNPDADIFTCGGRLICFDESTKQYRLLKDFNSKSKLELTCYKVCYVEAGICCRFIKIDFYHRNGFYSPLDVYGKHMFSNDKEFLLRAIINKVKNVHVNHLGYTYFAHDGSATFGNNRKNIIRICEEHLMIAQDYLNFKQLTFAQRLFMHYWYTDQATRVCLYRMLELNFNNARNVFINTLKKYWLIWPIAFSASTLHIAAKKTLRGLTKIIFKRKPPLLHVGNDA